MGAKRGSSGLAQCLTRRACKSKQTAGTTKLQTSLHALQRRGQRAAWGTWGSGSSLGAGSSGRVQHMAHS